MRKLRTGNIKRPVSVCHPTRVWYGPRVIRLRKRRLTGESARVNSSSSSSHRTSNEHASLMRRINMSIRTPSPRETASSSPLTIHRPKLREPLMHVLSTAIHYRQAVGGRPPRYAPPLSSLCGRRSASRRRVDRRACRWQRSSRFPRWILSNGHRCSCLLCKRRGE